MRNALYANRVKALEHKVRMLQEEKKLLKAQRDRFRWKVEYMERKAEAEEVTNEH